MIIFTKTYTNVNVTLLIHHEHELNILFDKLRINYVFVC